MTSSMMAQRPGGRRGMPRGSGAAARRWRCALGALALAGGLVLGGCAPAMHVAEEPGQEPGATEEQATAARALMRQLRNRPWADEAALELQRAEGWLDELERRLADDDRDERAHVLMLAVRTQLSEVKSFYAKREAEEALERVRGETEEQRGEPR